MQESLNKHNGMEEAANNRINPNGVITGHEIGAPDEYLKIEEAASLLRKKKGQIYQWVHNSAHGLSDFPYLKAGKSLRFSKTDLISWMKKHGKPLNK